MIKRIVGWFVLVPLCLALIVFALANRQLVVINFNPLVATEALSATGVGVPMFLVIFGVLLVGVVLGGIATWFAQAPHRREGRLYRRETERLHRELEVARRLPDGHAVLPTDELAHPN
jgi:uncharacterized membrane protein (DUF485 family)